MPGCRALCQGTGGTRCTSPAAGKTQDPDLTCENKDEFKDDVRPCRRLTSRTHKAGSSQVGAERGRATIWPQLHCSTNWYARARAVHLPARRSCTRRSEQRERYFGTQGLSSRDPSYHSRDTHERKQQMSAQPQAGARPTMHFITTEISDACC